MLRGSFYFPEGKGQSFFISRTIISIFFLASRAAEDCLGVQLTLLFSHFWEIFSGRTETLAIVRTLEEESSVVLFSF